MPTPRPETSVTSLAVENPGMQASISAWRGVKSSASSGPISPLRRAAAVIASGSMPRPSSLTVISTRSRSWETASLTLALAGLPAASHASRDCPPFQARVVKPRISTLTPQRSSVRARISAQVAATVIGRPRIEPELSSSNVTTVSRNVASFSCMKDNG